MSAFIVSNLHLNTIVSTMAHYGLYLNLADGTLYRAKDSAVEVFNILAKANVDSVNACYRETSEVETHFHPCRVDPTTPEKAIRLLQCLNYQSCEVENWYATPAAQIIAQAIMGLTTNIPAIDDNSWSI